MSKSSSSRSHLAFIIGLINLIGFFGLTMAPDNWAKFLIASIVLANLGALIIAKRDRRTILSLMFAVTFAIFHLSLLLIDIMSQEFISENSYLSRWYFVSYTLGAYVISALFLAGFSVSVLMLSAWKRTDERFVPPQKIMRSNVLIWVFAGLSVYFFAAVFLILGIENYSDYNEIARADNGGFVAASLVYLYPALAVSAFLCVVRVRSLKLFLVIFGCWALPTFAVGLRGEVLIPAAMMVPSLSNRFQIKVRVIPALLGSLVLLWLISFVRVYRTANNYEMALATASPFEGLLELGGSLRPVYEVVRWTESGIRDFYYGITYWAPLERLLLKVFPFAERLPAQLDDRLMNVAIVKIAGGNYGFSIAAEAYVNFGWLGVIAIAVLAGVVTLLAGERFANDRLGVVSIALVYALFYHIRQSYVGAWGSFFIVIPLAYSMMWVDHRSTEWVAKRARRPGTNGGPVQ